MATSRRTTNFRSSQRRKRVWTNTDVEYTDATGAKTSIDLLASYRRQPGAVGAGLTVMAIYWDHRPDNAGTTSGNEFWDVGLIVDAPPASAVPNPSNDEFADWMWNSRYYLDKGTATGHWENPAVGRQVCKSRRKVDEIGQTLFLSLAGTVGTATSLTYRGHFRVLLALP